MSESNKAKIGLVKAAPPPNTALTDWNIVLEVITPEKAKDYLATNILNRTVTKPTVDSFRRDMKMGRWQVTGDCIRFNKSGQLFDGQHRLAACIAAETEFTTFVARGMPDSAVDVIDSGRVRAAHDVLTMRGYTNTHMLASAARWLMVMRQGLQSTTDSLAILRPSHNEIIDVVMKHPKLIDSCTAAKNPKGTLPSLLAAMHYVGKEVLKTQVVEDKSFYADHFADVFVNGRPFFTHGDPALKLREMVLADRLRGVKPTAKTHYINMIYVWNAFSDNRSITTFRPPETITIRHLDTRLL